MIRFREGQRDENLSVAVMEIFVEGRRVAVRGDLRIEHLPARIVADERVECVVGELSVRRNPQGAGVQNVIVGGERQERSHRTVDGGIARVGIVLNLVKVIRLQADNRFVAHEGEARERHIPDVVREIVDLPAVTVLYELPGAAVCRTVRKKEVRCAQHNEKKNNQSFHQCEYRRRSNPFCCVLCFVHIAPFQNY